MTDSTTLYVLLVVFAATLIRSAFGFGEALFAVPLLALRLPLGIAAPLAVLISILIAAVVVVHDREKIHWRSAGWLVSATLLGIPAGLALLTSSHQRSAKATLAVVIMAFAIYPLIGRTPPSSRRTWDLALRLRPIRRSAGRRVWHDGLARDLRSDAALVRAALPRHPTGYFLPASIFGMAGYWWKGLWVPAVTHYFLLSLPATIPAIFLGRALNRPAPWGSSPDMSISVSPGLEPCC